MSVLSEIQSEGKKIFLSFLIGFLSSILVLRYFAWDFFESVMRSNMSDVLSDQVSIIAQTPFEVFLVQVKIGLFVGIVFTVPTLIYIFWDRVISDRDDVQVPVTALLISIIGGLALFVGGLWYSYFVFFPLIFNFLARITINAGVEAMYSIARWTQFMVLLSLSFGVLAQIPVSIPILVRYNVFTYQQIRSWFRYWIAITVTLGAVLSPPEPISQVLWAGPLIGLYAIAIVVSSLFSNDKNEEVEESQKEEVEKQDTDNEDDSEESDNIIDDMDDDVQDKIGNYYWYLSVVGGALQKNIIILFIMLLGTAFVAFYAQFAGLTEFLIETLKNPIESSERLDIVALHPVELLAFQAKISILISIIVTAPVGAYLIWPDIDSKINLPVNRNQLIGYIIPPILVFAVASVVGFLYISPSLLNILVIDASRIDAIIAYQISNFFWLVVYITFGFASLCTIYFTIIYLYIRRLPPRYLVEYWRHIILGIIVLSMLVTPSGVTKALLFATPLCLVFLVATATVWVVEYVRS